MRVYLVLAYALFGACVLNFKAGASPLSGYSQVQGASDDVFNGDEDPPATNPNAPPVNGDTPTMDQMFKNIMDNNNASMAFEQKNDGTVLVEMDIKMNREQYEQLKNTGGILQTFGSPPGVDTGNRRHKRKAIRTRRWTNKVVPYTLSNVFSRNDRAHIMAAFGDYHRYTCLRFRPATARDRDRIFLQNGGGCSSYVGMQGGTQVVSLASGCRIKRIVIHELGHAIGFNHEQTRPDRDRYVTIMRQNIIRGTEFNFNRFSTSVINSRGVPYDYLSVMHYGAKAFSRNGQYTIVANDRRYQSQMGRGAGFSFRDIKLANLIYNCNSHCGGKTCPGEGFVGKDCECWCPGTGSNVVTKCDGAGVITSGPKPVTPQPTNPTGVCNDQHRHCSYWRGQGFCRTSSTHYEYMSKKCRRSCNFCSTGPTSTCSDSNRYCASWARIGYCRSRTYWTFMRQNCRRSCGICR